MPLYENSYNQSKALDNILRNIHRSGFGSKLLRKPIKIRLFLSRNYINNTDEFFTLHVKHDAKIEFKVNFLSSLCFLLIFNIADKNSIFQNIFFYFFSHVHRQETKTYRLLRVKYRRSFYAEHFTPLPN